MRPLREEYEVPGLATVIIDMGFNAEPDLMVILDPTYPIDGDLRDIARANPGPDNVFLRCDAHQAINNANLLRFVEVLAQWDKNGDQVPDYGYVVAAIEEAMYLSVEAPHQFTRPNTGLAKLVNLIMPRQPEFQIVLSFGDLKPRFRLRHYVAAIPLLAVMLGLIQVQVHLLPWTRFSVITGINWMVSHSGLSAGWRNFLIAFLIAFLVNKTFGGRRRAKSGKTVANTTFSVHTTGLMNRAALSEEQWFREGSQNWTFGQRLRSCLAFGFVHLGNLIYPLATILPLALGGAFFMAMYLRAYKKSHFRRAAVLEAATYHRVYNRGAIVVVVIALALTIGWWAVGALGGMFVLGYFGIRVKAKRHGHHIDVYVEEVPIAAE